MSRWSWIPLSLLTVAAVPPPMAYSQAIDWIASEDGVTIARDPGSARLEGMGGISIAIQDERNKLDLYRYGGNISALLWESDTRRWDFWGRTATIVHDQFDAQGVRDRVRVEGYEYGGRMAWRNGNQRVLGLEFVHDTIERGAGSLDDSKIRGPWWGAFGGQKVGRVVIGGGIHLTGDNQDLTTEDFFAIRHSSNGQRYVGSLAIDAGAIDFGLQAERQVNEIEGRSRDEARFHEDIYTWKRPIAIYDGSAVWTVNDALRGAFRARAMKIDGRQDVKISWSDRMPENPGRLNVVLRTGTFDERVRTYEAGTRWEMRPAETLLLAAEGSLAKTDTEVEEGYNFKGSRRAEDTEDRVARAGAGLSFQTPSKRFRVGAEGWFVRDSHEDVLAGGAEVVSRVLELRSGTEYFVGDAFALRAGYIRSAEDENTDLPRTLGIGNGFSIGAGYLPRGGLYQIDAAIRLVKVLPDYEGDPRSEERRTFFSMTARLLL